MTYQPSPNVLEGNKIQTEVSDDDVISLLGQILKELKIMNLHLSLMTDNQINKTDIE